MSTCTNQHKRMVLILFQNVKVLGGLGFSESEYCIGIRHINHVRDSIVAIRLFDQHRTHYAYGLV